MTECGQEGEQKGMYHAGMSAAKQVSKEDYTAWG